MAVPPNVAAAVTNECLRLTINTTEQCNLRCKYCYEDFLLKEMPSWVVAGILRLIEQRIDHGLRRLEIEFFGGEPLAAWKTLAELSAKMFGLCERGGVEFVGGITTNATRLSRDRLDFLLAYGIRNFQITLDGPKQIHDQRRVTQNGAGTFAAIWKALQIIKSSRESKLDSLIRLHYDPFSYPLLLGKAGFVNEIVSTFLLDDPRFRLLFLPITKLGGDGDKNVIVFPANSERAALPVLIEQAVTAGAIEAQLPQFSAGSLGESGLEICYAARANAFVIRSNGDVAKCTVAFNDERNAVGRITPTGELEVDHERHLPWLSGLMTGDSNQLSCPALHVIWGVSN